MVIFYLGLAVADKRNRTALHKKRCRSKNGSWIRRYKPWFLKLLKEFFAQLHQTFYKHEEKE